MNIFTENTYKRLKIVNKINPKYSDSLLKYLNNLPEIEFIKPNYITLSEKPPLGALIESRFARYDSILNSVKLLHKKYVLDLKPHKIIIYGNNVSTIYINHVASIIRWWEKIKPQTYYITFYLTNIKKRLPPNNLPKVLSEEYMNSGFTFIKEPCDIHIFRKEESLKVLIHELIHASKFDFNNQNLNNTPVIIRDEDLSNEGITEYLAIIHYYWYVANYIKTIEFLDLLAYDLGWQAYQISKILHYFELKPSDLLTKNNNFKQKTSVISYFFLKNYFFSQDSLPIILSRDIKKINELIGNMKQFLIDYKMEPIFQNSLSMRMSLYELEY
jgi:hypothetical protein